MPGALPERRVLRSFRKVTKQRRAQPTLLIEVSRVIPIAVPLSALPVKPILMAWKRRAGEDEREAPISVRNVSDGTINQGIGARDEWLLFQANASVVEDHWPWCLYGEITLIAFIWVSSVDLTVSSTVRTTPFTTHQRPSTRVGKRQASVEHTGCLSVVSTG
jgi:hypothetical protein